MPHASLSLFYNPSHRKKFLIVATIVLWVVVLGRTLTVLGPDSDHAYFNSDGAIPVIMANDPRPITVFDHYYYAAGRWGGWPLITARLVNHATNYRWSPERLNFVRVVWLFLGILVLALLNRRAAFFVVLICSIVICLHGTIRLRLFDLSQVYSWQITPLLFGWYSARRLFSENLARAKESGLVLSRALWCLLLFWSSFLSIWSSFASGPLLLFLVSLEGVRSHLITGKAPAGKWMKTRYLWGLALVAAAILAEMLMRINYHRHSQKHYGNAFKTSMAIDTGYLTHNLDTQLIVMRHFTFWPLILIALLALIVTAVTLSYFTLKRRTHRRAELMKLVLEDSGILIAGTFGIAAINFGLIVVVNHVRLNLYDNRFATLTFLFGSISGLLTLYFLLWMVLRKARISRWGIPALMCLGFIFLMIKFPAPNPSGLYRVEKETALALTNKTPHAVLLGGYWSTYVFAALQPGNTIVPLPLEGEFVRMPWTIKMLRDETHVIVEYRRTVLQGAHTPPDHLIQYGNSLQLVDPKFYENGPYAFALYLNTTN